MRKELVINHPKLKVWFVEGTEGPRHDPYGYEEIRAVTPLGETVLHEGLGVWLQHDNEKLKPERILGKILASIVAKDPDKWSRRMFGQLVGYTPAQIKRIVQRLQSRCTRCGNSDFEDVRGHPGETLRQCAVCHHINGGSMNFSAIE